MPGLNRIQLIGYLGKDPESHYTPHGNKVCKFTVAVSRRWKGQDGAMKEATDWFNIEAWRKLGEICQQYLTKGALVYIEGRVQTDRYEQGGETRYFTKIIAGQMQMLERKGADEPAAVDEEEIFE